MARLLVRRLALLFILRGAAGLLPEQDRDAFIEEVLLAIEACRPFELEAFREGHLTPVFFGSALSDFGVKQLLDEFVEYAPRPVQHTTEGRVVQADEEALTGFVF